MKKVERYRCKVDFREWWVELDAYLRNTTEGEIVTFVKQEGELTYLHQEEGGVTYWVPTNELDELFEKIEC